MWHKNERDEKIICPFVTNNRTKRYHSGNFVLGHRTSFSGIYTGDCSLKNPNSIYEKCVQIWISQRHNFKPTLVMDLTLSIPCFFVLMELDNKLAVTNRELSIIRDFLAETTNVESDNRGLRLELQRLSQIHWILNSEMSPKKGSKYINTAVASVLRLNNSMY